MPEDRQPPENASGRDQFPQTFPESLLDSPLRVSTILNPVEAARFLGGLNARTVTRWAREGYLPAIPVGEGKRRLWRFVKGDLEHWMLSRRTGTLRTAADAPNGGFVR